eukprot:CAMPEP_0119363248 /NCGR_PEP_ID=MMETSP1334-20130426/10157_1 /TAXON_ID=127549 /ORGANISM="Calcidiscus leptoporus, Strain RCC1130" /LENGTH=59 /DNA_ID=CAMNT_0007378643 /DNA_START=93 /DNA_END=272 /DNA_ORIENTATION=-
MPSWDVPGCAQPQGLTDPGGGGPGACMPATQIDGMWVCANSGVQGARKKDKFKKPPIRN